MSAVVPGNALPSTEAALTVLCVDDEANILSSLRRLLRPHGYRVLSAGSGAAGLGIIAESRVDLVLSDMRMPEMDGAQFLEQVKARSPDTIRVLLTGYADLQSTVSAINNAQIYRYISKPWDDAALVGIVKDALERKVLEREKARLEGLVQQQNEELRQLNATLEAKVEARTAELNAALGRLQQVHDKLKTSFVTSITVFSGLIELREGPMAGRSRRIAELARRIAQQMKLSTAGMHDVALAGLLHGIGRFGLSEALLAKGPTSLTPEERDLVMKHPVNAQTVLMPLEQLHGAGELIRSYRERYDGRGYPDALSGSAIPVGARILAVAHDFEAAQDGALTGVPLSKGQAREHIIAGRGNRYDPAVVAAFLETLEGSGGGGVAERLCAAAELKPGMVLTRDLVTPDGILLLSKDSVLDAALIEKLARFQTRAGASISAYVRVR